MERKQKVIEFHYMSESPSLFYGVYKESITVVFWNNFPANCTHHSHFLEIEAVGYTLELTVKSTVNSYVFPRVTVASLLNST